MNRLILLRPTAFGALRAALCVCAVIAVGCARPAHADQIGDLLNAASTKLAPSIVSIRAISTITTTAQGQTQDHDVTSQFCGVIVSPDGLVMCTDDYFSSTRMRDAVGMPSDDSSVNITVKPREIRITVGNEPTEYYGSLATYDPNLNLAFVQIRDLNGRILPFVDLANVPPADAPPNIGDPTASVTRLSKTFDYAPLAVEDRVVAIASKPRKLYVPEGFAGSLGLPVCGPSGNILGVVSSFSTGDQSQEDVEAGHLSALFEDVVNEDRSQFVVPVAVVAPLIAEAKAQAASLPPFVKPTPRPSAPTKSVKTPTTPPTAPPAK